MFSIGYVGMIQIFTETFYLTENKMYLFVFIHDIFFIQEKSYVAGLKIA